MSGAQKIETNSQKGMNLVPSQKIWYKNPLASLKIRRHAFTDSPMPIDGGTGTGIIHDLFAKAMSKPNAALFVFRRYEMYSPYSHRIEPQVQHVDQDQKSFEHPCGDMRPRIEFRKRRKWKTNMVLRTSVFYISEDRM
eukprot:gb/GECG01001511.1/.p1 GENE.gb/GECG01001511.1/~~gb/GECG01001511.1/.p1  ORF type:complete len:138 (+),score=9.02 gb/GECG01001511.1/:1-414(+)